MVDPNDMKAKEDELRRLFEERLAIKAPRFDRALRKAGRLVPKHLQADGAVLADAFAKTGHPKLMVMLDAKRISRAHEQMVTFLQSVDPKERRKDAVLGTLGVVAFNLLAVFVLLIAVLLWRGFL